MYSYRTRGTCSQQIDVELDGDIIKSVQFYGGCNGNLQGISSIVRGKTIEEVEKALLPAEVSEEKLTIEHLCRLSDIILELNKE